VTSIVHIDARLGNPWLRVNRVLRMMLHTHWSAEAWSVVRVEFRKALALRSEIRHLHVMVSMRDPLPLGPPPTLTDFIAGTPSRRDVPVAVNGLAI
jgi:hypothetical protein